MCPPMPWLVDEEPPDVEPVCEIHECPLYPARPIPCPECEAEAEWDREEREWEEWHDEN